MKPGDLVTAIGEPTENSQYPLWHGHSNSGPLVGWMTSKRIGIVLACKVYGHASLGDRTSVLVLNSKSELGWNDEHFFVQVTP